MNKLQEVVASGLTTVPLLIGMIGCDRPEYQNDPTEPKQTVRVHVSDVASIPLTQNGEIRVSEIPSVPQNDSSGLVTVPYDNAEYTINMQEINDFNCGNSIYGGKSEAVKNIDNSGVYHTIANHGAFVAKKGESSLERLVNSVVSTESKKEIKAQKLLDLVTQHIIYDNNGMNSTDDVLKTPSAVLMTGNADCSGKVILYASLLEQTNIDYRLLYMDGHISVAVEGDFGNKNGLSLTLNGKSFSIAETTIRDFQIGQTQIDEKWGFNGIEYIQRPGKDAKIYDAKTGKALAFF